jgi:hypothetical protein
MPSRAAARDDLDAALRIGAEQRLGLRVALERDLALLRREHRVAALDPQLCVVRIEVEELLEVLVGSVVLADGER